MGEHQVYDLTGDQGRGFSPRDGGGFSPALLSRPVGLALNRIGESRPPESDAESNEK